MRSTNPARRNGLLLVALLFAQLLLMSGGVQRSDGSTALHGAVARLTSPAVWVGRAVAGGFSGVVDGIRELRSAQVENVRLTEEVGRLRAELDEHREQGLENERLRRLLAMKEHIAPRSVGASVAGKKRTRHEHMISVDRGTNDGVREDQAVIAWGGAVGRVVEAFPGSAKVRLLTDPNSGVAGVVERSRVEGMVLGLGTETLEMIYMPEVADVAYGDRVVTSGIDTVFPKGVGIGRVVGVDPEEGGTKVDVQSDVDWLRLEEVLVIVERADGATLSARNAEAAE